MSKLFSILKRSAAYILMIVALLVVQAMCDLSLPSYTSDIVNIGIQQGGINSAYPEYLTKATLDSIKAFATDDEKRTIEAGYEYIAPDSERFNKLLKNNPNLSRLGATSYTGQKLYAVKEGLSEQSISDLENAVRIPFICAEFTLPENRRAIEKMTGEKAQNTAEFNFYKKPQSAQSAKAYTNAIREKISELASDYDSTMIKQMSAMFIKGEYIKTGINTDRLQNTYIIVTGLKMLGLSAVAMTAAILISFLASWVAARCGRDMRVKVFNKVLRFTNREFDEFSTASLITRSTNDIQQIQMLIVMMARMVLYAPIIGIGAFLKVLNSNTSMSWIIGLAVVVILSIVITLFTLTMPKFQKIQKQVDRVNLVAREILTGLPVIRAFTNERHEEERFDKANKELTKTNLFVNRMMSVMMPTMMLVMNAISILIIWVGSKYVDSGSMMVGDLLAFIQYTMQIIMAFLMISMMSIMLPRAAVSVKRIAEVLDKKVSLKDPESEKEFDESKKGTIEFKDVYFRYPNAQEDVLNNISFVSKPGETTAFIGSTGSGKSTLINLIPRFFDVTGGKILIDGVDVRDVSQKSLREKIGYVPQKGVLFSGTVASNISYGDEDMPAEDIVRAAKIAQADEFISGMPEKYENPISQGGSNVSGGQKQRLSIARAIAKKPEIMIFDDSFSALDFKTDANLRQALAAETKDSTVLIVAQRISTVMDADQIVVLDDGHVAGIGTHRELLKTCEVYRQIASSQLSKEELENE